MDDKAMVKKPTHCLAAGDGEAGEALKGSVKD